MASTIDIVSVAYPPAHPMTDRAKGDITDFIIHHTAGSITQTPLEIDTEHRNIGDAMIAYNWVIGHDGTIYSGRPITVESAASFGRNPVSVAVVLVGQFEPDAKFYTGPPTAAQIESLKKLCLWAHVNIPSIVRTLGHRDIAPMFYPDNEGDYSTACPGRDLYVQIPAIKQYVTTTLAQR